MHALVTLTRMLASFVAPVAWQRSFPLCQMTAGHKTSANLIHLGLNLYLSDAVDVVSMAWHTLAWRADLATVAD